MKLLNKLKIITFNVERKSIYSLMKLIATFEQKKIDIMFFQEVMISPNDISLRINSENKTSGEVGEINYIFNNKYENIMKKYKIYIDNTSISPEGYEIKTDNRKISLVTVVNKNLIPYSTRGHFKYLAPTVDKRFYQRKFTILKIKYNNSTIFLINVHLKSGQIRNLYKNLLNLSSDILPINSIFIVAGDLNIHSDDVKYMNDTKRITRLSSTQQGTFKDFGNHYYIVHEPNKIGKQGNSLDAISCYKNGKDGWKLCEPNIKYGELIAMVEDGKKYSDHLIIPNASAYTKLRMLTYNQHIPLIQINKRHRTERKTACSLLGKNQNYLSMLDYKDRGGKVITVQGKTRKVRVIKKCCFCSKYAKYKLLNLFVMISTFESFLS